MFFSKDELRDIFIAIAAMTIIFAYPNLVVSIPAAFIIVVISFLLHEISHKIAAMHYGVKAYFKLWPFGTILGLIFMFLNPLKIVTIGSVVIYPQKFGRWKRRYLPWSRFTEITYREIGVITSMGPLINILLATFSWLLMNTIFTGNLFLAFMTLINSWMALVHLIPLKPLDGVKIFTWKPWFWFIMIVVSTIFLVNTVPIFLG